MPSFFSHLIDRLSGYSPLKIIVLVTLTTTLISALLVSCTLFLIAGKLHPLVISLSVIMPLILTPPILAIVIKLVLRLETYKNALHKEIEKNREKDMLLFEQERFALMGEMLSNISHQWRQPLNTINLTLLSTKLAQATERLDDETLENAFDTIEQNTLYLSDTIEDFRSFFQNKTPTKVLPLQQIIYELNSIITPTLQAKNIQLEMHWDDDLIHRLEMATAISQVLLNLINNAKEALEPLHQEHKQIALEISTSDEHITVAVTDNGPGIDAAIQPKIFDPYFSTKGQLKGSGIGLHMSRQIIQKIFHGSIDMHSVPQKTRFTLALPYSDYCKLND